MSARAIADIEAGLILASVDIAVPCDRVFQALTDPKELVNWWGSPETYQTTSWDGELKVGGQWRAEGKGADGNAFEVHGDFLEIDPPHRLVMSWMAGWDGHARTVVTYRLEPTDKGTHLTVVHRGFEGRPDACNGHGRGWQLVLGWLSDFVRPKPQNIYVTRLIPPRPSFAFDLSPEERTMMERHAAYWQGLAAEGRVIVLGPVNDGVGPYGLGVIRATDEKDLQSLLDSDPAIAEKRGLRYESAPMMRAIMPG